MRKFLPINRLLLGCVLLVTVVVGLVFGGQFVKALDPVEELQQQINELEKLKQMSAEATKPLEKELAGLEQKIKNAQNGIIAAKKQASVVAEGIKKREEDLAVQYVMFSSRIASSYRRARTYSPLQLLLSSGNAAQLTKDLAYQTSIQAQDNKLIRDISSEIAALQRDKQKLEEDQIKLAKLQSQLDSQAQFFRKEIAGAKAYQQDLSGKIAALSAKQQSIISARSGTAITSVGEVPLADDFNASIGYKSQAPSNSFAVFSFGGYTHRNGMSQYGARRQAEEGRSYKEIIQWYYKSGTKNEGSTDTIEVKGYGNMDFQKYLYGLAEMPSSWPAEALKAQAVAARTYAMRQKRSGYSCNPSRNGIGTDERCQAFSKSKSDNPPDAWKKAVDETNHEVIDGDVSAQYSSTAGGYSNMIGWDTTDKNGGGDWSSRAWESKAGSPWFYKSWYRSGYSSSGANCGRNHPWLSQEEMADIINAWLVRKNPSGADTERIEPVTINTCTIGGGGGNPYSMSELRDWANKAGGAVTSISGVSVSHSGNGQTAEVRFETNRGTISISGSEFKSTFNLRAPGYLRIPQSSFAFFNIEHKK